VNRSSDLYRNLYITLERRIDYVLRFWSQRSRSQSDGHGNVVNSIACELLEGLERKLIRIFIVLGRRTELGFQGQRPKMTVICVVYICVNAIMMKAHV